MEKQWKTCDKQKRLSKMDIQRSYMSHQIFDNDLIVIRKNKVTLMPNKPAYIGMRILELSKVLMYEFHYNYIKNRYGNNSKFLFANTDSLMYHIYEHFSSNKKFLILVMIRLSENTMMIQTN